ncbi:hypothetical protein GVN24_31530 [Rhizobium sp. CRIBSB]|nr:hypothetical protein [Rhizobium sp. CRIBSB]
MISARRVAGGPAALLLTALIAACASTDIDPVQGGPADPTPAVPETPPQSVLPSDVPSVQGPGPQTLPGWDQEHHLEAFEAWVAGCGAAVGGASRDHGKVRLQKGPGVGR